MSEAEEHQSRGALQIVKSEGMPLAIEQVEVGHLAGLRQPGAFCKLHPGSFEMLGYPISAQGSARGRQTDNDPRNLLGHYTIVSHYCT